MKKLLFLAGMFLAVSFTFAGVNKGDFELSFDFSFTDTSSAGTNEIFDLQEIFLDFDIGYFLHKDHEVLFLINYSYIKYDDFGPDFHGGLVGMGYRFNFTASDKIVLFSGLKAGVWLGEDARDIYEWSWKVEAGSRFFIQERWSINTMLFYQANTAAEDFTFYQYYPFVSMRADDEKNLGIAAGLSVFF